MGDDWRSRNVYTLLSAILVWLFATSMPSDLRPQRPEAAAPATLVRQGCRARRGTGSTEFARHPTSDMAPPCESLRWGASRSTACSVVCPSTLPLSSP